MEVTGAGNTRERLWLQLPNTQTKDMKVTKLYDPLMHPLLTLSVTIVAQQMMSQVGGDILGNLVKDHTDV